MTTVKDYFRLCRVRIALLSAFSAAAGFILACRRPDLGALVIAAGVFLLSCGCSGLNQYQERATDSFMERTRGRPIPSGRMAPLHGLSFSLFLIGLGWASITLTSGLTASALGLVAALWYNAVYTYLKRRSAFASVPGAVIGAIPPAIGWVAAGGSLTDSRLLALCSFFFLWQVPHFWLLLLRHGEEYEKAGLPSLTGVFGKRQLSLVTFQWVCAAAVMCTLLVLFRLTTSPVGKGALLALPAVLLLNSLPLLRVTEDGFSIIFSRINQFMVLVLLFLTMDGLGLLSYFREAYAVALMAND